MDPEDAPIIQRKGEFGIALTVSSQYQNLLIIGIEQCQADPRPTLNDDHDEEETMSDVGSYTDSMEDIEDIIGFVYSVDLSQVSTKIIDSYYHAVTQPAYRIYKLQPYVSDPRQSYTSVYLNSSTPSVA